VKTWDALVSRENLLAEFLSRRLSNSSAGPPVSSSYSSIPPFATSYTLRQTELGERESEVVKNV
jgi:hypothetical protein